MIGLAVAYELAKTRSCSVMVLEKEPQAGTGSTAACTGGIRLQFSSGSNVVFSTFSLERYKRFSEEFGVDIILRQTGYLFLITRQTDITQFTEGQRVQRRFGVRSEFVDAEWIEDSAPFLFMGDIVSGSFCGEEAHADPHMVVSALLEGCREHGVYPFFRQRVTDIDLSNGRVHAVRTSDQRIACKSAVICAGPDAGGLLRTAGCELPLIARKRHVLAVKPEIGFDPSLPLIVDSESGWYLRSEPGGIALMGGTDRDAGSVSASEPEEDICNRIIEAGVHRAPSIEQAGLIRTIAGYRCLTPDDHALIGEVPEAHGLYCAVGFSGHGFMHAPAVGAALSELILTGNSGTLDLAAFEPGRFSGSRSLSAAEQYVF